MFGLMIEEIRIKNPYAIKDPELLIQIRKKALDYFNQKDLKIYSYWDLLDDTQFVYSLEEKYKKEIYADLTVNTALQRRVGQITHNISYKRISFIEEERKEYTRQYQALRKKFKSAPWHFEWPAEKICRDYGWKEFRQFLVSFYFGFLIVGIILYLIRGIEESFSWKQEFILCPRRIILALILWPKYIWSYPKFLEPAQHLRYLKIKAEFFMNLKNQKQEIKKKSLAMAYLSLVIANIVLIIPKNSQALATSDAPSICVVQTQEEGWGNLEVGDDVQIPCDLLIEDINFNISSEFAKLPQLVPSLIGTAEKIEHVPKQVFEFLKNQIQILNSRRKIKCFGICWQEL